MDALLHAWELVTRDAFALGASAALAIALLSLLAFAAWPSRGPRTVRAPRRPRQAPRSERARALVASGASPVDVARRTGLSRDALALLREPATPAARQKGPEAAPIAFPRRAAPTRSHLAQEGQVTA